MWNLNAIEIFGQTINWPMETALFWLLIAQVALVIFMVVVFAILILRVKRGPTQVVVQSNEEERALVGIELDTSLVTREFAIGEEFSCDGLVITAHYNKDPYSEILHEVMLLTPEKLEELMQDNKRIEDLEGCVVYVPKLEEEGKSAVTVAYHGKTAVYVVNVVTEHAVAAYEGPKERELVGISLDTTVVRREFTVGEPFNCEGLVVTANYNVEPLSEQVLDFTVYMPDMNVEGKPVVTVEFGGKTAVYPISIAAEKEEEPAAERELVGISLDASMARREFTVGEPFNCEGLIVTANYNVEPLSEQVLNFTVYMPDMNVEGKPVVTVEFGGKTAVYAISVVAEKEEEPAAERELVGISLDASMARREFTVGEPFNCEGLIVTANYSEPPYSEVVTDYVIDVPDMSAEGKPTVTVRYGEKSAVYVVSVAADVHRELLHITLDTELVQREFTEGGRFNAEGLVVYASYSEEPCVEKVEDYAVDAPDLSQAGEAIVTVRYGGKRASYPVTVLEAERPAERELIGITLHTDNVRKEYIAGEELDPTGLVVIANYNLEPFAEEVEDYEILPVDMTQVGAPTVLVRYGEKTIGYQITVSPATVIINEEPEVIRLKAEPIYIQEEMHAKGTLRYDRSFTARLIQSDDEVKHWYTELKNYLLSYKKVRARMSWKRESFRFGREPVVRLAYRGKTLCVYLPLDPMAYEETKYKVEPIKDCVSYEDTPCMYRIKNSRRVKYAMELIDTVMERLGAQKNENYISEDFYLPYEGVVELINRGLIKRNIKSAEDEAFFRQNAGIAEEESVPEDVEIAPGVIVTGVSLEQEKRRTLPVPESAPVEETVEEPASVEEAAEEPAAPVEAVIEEPAPVEEKEDEPAPVEEAVEEPIPIEEVVEEPTPVEETVEEPASVEETAEEPAAPVEAVIEEPAPVEEVVEEPTPVEETVEEPAPVEEVVEEPTPVEETVEEPAPVEEVVEEPASVEETAEEPAPIEEVVEEPASVEETAEEPAPVEETAEEPVPVEETAEETASIEEVFEEPVPIEEIFEESAPVEEAVEEPAPIGEIAEEAAPAEDGASDGTDDTDDADDAGGTDDAGDGVVRMSMGKRRRMKRRKHR